MAKQETRTAYPKLSIWFDLPETTFRQNLVELEKRTNAVPINPQAFDIEEWVSTCPDASTWTHTLPIEVEQQLADDFACLAAVEEGAQSVAAVCIEEHVEAPGMTLRFAALDLALNERVQVALEEISRILADTVDEHEETPSIQDSELSLILSRSLSRAGSDTSNAQEHSDQIFHCVVALHFRRLLGRLRSQRWDKPQHLMHSHKKPLWQDFANLIHRVQFVYTKQEKSQRQVVEKILVELATMYRHFEEANLDDELSAMKRLVRQTFKLCSRNEIRDYVKRLERSVGPKITSKVAAAIKTIRQCQKIGAYRRICLSLVKTAQSYPGLFQNGFKIEYLTPYESVPTSVAYETWAETCHVHAEVQLAVHYDLLSQFPPSTPPFLEPRCIGISKWLCYLCFEFLREHGRFFPSKTHGRLYDQWTVPDLDEFELDLVERYRDVLAGIDDEVARRRELKTLGWRMEPMTSIDLPSYLHSQ